MWQTCGGVPRSRPVLLDVAINAYSRWSMVLTRQLSVFVAATAKIVKLRFEHRPHLLIDHMANHAWIVTSVVHVVVMTHQAVLGNVIFVSKRHRQDRLGTSPSMFKHWSFRRQRRAEHQQRRRRQHDQSHKHSHNYKFRMLAKTSTHNVPIARYFRQVCRVTALPRSVLWLPLHSTMRVRTRNSTI